MPYVSVATQAQVSGPQSFSSFLHPQPKPDLQKFQCRLIADRPPSPTHKPLRSSLKRSRSSSCKVVSEPTTPRTPSRARTSLPPNPKCVHFKGTDDELESICLFHATGRPSAISHPRSYSDTETETDTDSALAAQFHVGTMFTVADTSPIPSPHTPPESNVHLESLTLLPARLPLLRGTLRVRNIAFEKTVTARFTTDGWTTVSESRARYAGPGTDAWDRFAFTIPLEVPRTLLLAVRYSVPDVGEWWDNNGGADFRIELAPATPRRPVPAPGATPAAPRPLRALVSKANAYPTFVQSSLPVPPVTGPWLRFP